MGYLHCMQIQVYLHYKLLLYPIKEKAIVRVMYLRNTPHANLMT